MHDSSLIYFGYPDNRCYYAFTRGQSVCRDGFRRSRMIPAGSIQVSCHDALREEQALAEERDPQQGIQKRLRSGVVLIHIPVFHAGGVWYDATEAPIRCSAGKIDLAISGHTHGVFDPDAAAHHYPIVIGSGCGTATRRGGPPNAHKG